MPTVLELLAVTVTGPAAHRHTDIERKYYLPHLLCSIGGDNKKPSCCCDSRSCSIRRSVIYWQTIKPVTSLRTAG